VIIELDRVEIDRVEIEIEKIKKVVGLPVLSQKLW